MKFTLFSLLLLFLPWVSTLGQASHSIQGTLVDMQQKPVPFGTIALYRTADSSLVTGTTSNEKGIFTVSAKPDMYYLKVSVLSYQEKVVRAIRVSDGNVGLGTVTLRPATEVLKEVVVVGEQQQMELQLDKRVFNVSSDLSSISSSASEILENVPSVTVDMDGNVSLRGSQHVRILIDGRPSGLTGINTADALKQLQANLIERVEVITNPSSQYDAEGEVGIINIVLKKKQVEGFSGSFVINMGYPLNAGGSFDVNYRKKRLNLFSSYGLNYRYRPGYGSSYQSFTGDSVFAYRENSTRDRRGTSHTFRVGSDYYLTDRDVLTGSVVYRRAYGDNRATYVYQDFNAANESVRTVTRNEEETNPEYTWETALGYHKELPQKGRVLTADFKWIENHDLELTAFGQQNTETVIPLYQRSTNTANEQNLWLQADYVHPFGEKGKWEAGVKSASRILKNDFLVEQQTTGQWAALAGYDYNLTYQEKIHAAYVMAGNQFYKLGIQMGVRGEFSDITTALPDEKFRNNRTYFNLFPSLHLSYTLSETQSVQLSYSYRISRPGFRDLLPFSSFSNNRALRVGNPNLNPEYTHSFEGAYLLKWANGSWLSSAYYRYRTGVIQRITVVDSVGASRSFPVNLATEKTYGLENTLSHTVHNWWRININVHLFRAMTQGFYEGRLFERDTYLFSSRLSSKMTFQKKWNFQVGANYQSPHQMPQGRTQALYTIDLGLAWDVLKGNGSLVFNVRDLLNSRKYRNIISQENYYSSSIYQSSVRQFTITFSFRIKRKKDASDRERSAPAEENGNMD